MRRQVFTVRGWLRNLHKPLTWTIQEPRPTCNSRWTRWTRNGRPAMDRCMLWTSSDKRQEAKDLDLACMVQWVGGVVLSKMMGHKENQSVENNLMFVFFFQKMYILRFFKRTHTHMCTHTHMNVSSRCRIDEEPFLSGRKGRLLSGQMLQQMYPETNSWYPINNHF